MTDTDVMTVQCVGEYLEIEPRTIYRLVATGGIPGLSTDGPWQLREGEVDLMFSEWVRIYESCFHPSVRGPADASSTRAGYVAPEHRVSSIETLMIVADAHPVPCYCQSQ